ncbi:MAG: phosphatase PAP2 family protein [Patescibacteria group bacterium]
MNVFGKISRIQIICFIISIAFLGLFYGYSRAVRNEFGKALDFSVTVKIQERIDKSSKLRAAELIGNIMEGSTFLASPEVSTVVVIVLGLISLVDVKKKRLRYGSLLIFLAFFLLVLGEMYGKSVVHHPSPPFYMIKNPTSVFPKNYINEQFSYPSGHAARAIFIGIVLLGVYWYKQCKNGAILTIKSLMTPKTLLVVCLVALYVMLVAVSRIYIGHHWFSDIFGGVLLGSGFGLLALAFILPDPYNTKYMNS